MRVVSINILTLTVLGPYLRSLRLIAIVIRIRDSSTPALFSGRQNLTKYAYDPIGNRLSATNNAKILTYLANSLNQYINIHDGITNTPTYDLDGNLTNDGVFAYSWDGENRLVAVEPLVLTNGSPIKVTFTYDYMGRRVEKRRFAWLQWDRQGQT